jgi:LysM repeat protein
VQPGDNLFRIAMRYNTTWEAIAQANGITDVTQVAVGQELVIPAGGEAPPPSEEGTTYVVQPGDNLFRIALRYNLDYRRLAAYNGIANPSNIYVGQVLQIPPQ